MKYLKFIPISLLSITIYSCESETAASVMNKGGTVAQSNGMLHNTYDLTEFEYKEHTYISCQVRDGISLTHAGHCKCNLKK